MMVALSVCAGALRGGRKAHPCTERIRDAAIFKVVAYVTGGVLLRLARMP